MCKKAVSELLMWILTSLITEALELAGCRPGGGAAGVGVLAPDRLM